MLLSACLRVLSGLTLLASCSLTIVAFTTNYWTVKRGELDVHAGVWTSCNATECIRTIDDPFYEENSLTALLVAVQTFGCLSILAFVATLAYYVLTCLFLEKSCHFFLISAFILISGLLLCVAGGIYARNFGSETRRWGWSFTCAWLSVVITLLSFSMSFIYSRMVTKQRRYYGEEEMIYEQQ